MNHCKIDFVVLVDKKRLVLGNCFSPQAIIFFQLIFQFDFLFQLIVGGKGFHERADFG